MAVGRGREAGVTVSGHAIPIARHGRDTVPVASARTEETLRDAMDCAARAMTRCGLALAAVRRGEDCELDWQQARVLAAGLARALGLEVRP